MLPIYGEKIVKKQQISWRKNIEEKLYVLDRLERILSGLLL